MSPESCCNIDEQRLSNISLIFIGIGALLTFPSLMWPIDFYYNIDPHLSAKENEEREEAHSRTLYTLSTVAFVGMAFIGCGAIITSVLLTKIIVLQACTRTEVKQKDGENKRDLKQKPQIKQVIGAQDCGVNLQKTPNFDNQNTASSIQEETLPRAQNEGKLLEKDKLVGSGRLEINRDFSHVKLYGSVDK